ncbi:E-selectin-like [Dreissena polymorpha]|uniref:E-selectin-like n=1 Tax=Dreissena polymorpha TaxID=45954 RepID=UPI0022654F85|nr:E-selectin-like [Dreissena polymorpha]
MNYRGRLGFLILLSLGVDKVTLRDVETTAYYCYGDSCNLNRTDQYCDMAFRFCRRCSDIQDDCFSAFHVNNCSAFCYDLRHRRDQEKERVAGCRVPTPPANGSYGTMLSKVPYNTTLRASCYYGYRLSCSTALQCGDYGIWRGTLPECKEITCLALPEVFNGR